MNQNILGMERETYQGFRIDHEPDSDTTKSYRDHWFNVYEGSVEGKPIFRVRMRVHWEYAIKVLPPGTPPVRGSVEVAAMLGLRWVHGLIDLSRFEQGRTYEEERGDAWQPTFGDSDLDDDRLRIELLRALQRMNRAQQSQSEILELDVDGIADVLGISGGRIRGLLSELLLEALVETVAPTFGKGAEDGACRITGLGLQTLRQTPIREEAARVIFLEDIDSFDRARDVPPTAVTSMLPGGLLPIPEADVKNYLCEIIGENYTQKDWGGERSDVFTTQVRIGGQRVPPALLLKGPGVGRSVMRPSDLGSRADQDLRLFTEPAELFVVQFNGRIDSSVVQRVRITADFHARREGRTLLCFIDGTDTARLLMAYGKAPEVS